VFKSNKRWNAFYRNLKRTFEDLLLWYCYAINPTPEKIRSQVWPRKGVNTSELQAHHCLTPEQWTCLLCSVSVIPKNTENRGNARLPPCGRPWSEVMTTFFWKISAKCTNSEVSSLSLVLQVSSVGVLMKFRSRLEILTRSRSQSRRLRSRLHHCYFLVLSLVVWCIFCLMRQNEMYDTQIQNELGFKVRENLQFTNKDKKPLPACHH